MCAEGDSMYMYNIIYTYINKGVSPFIFSEFNHFLWFNFGKSNPYANNLLKSSTPVASFNCENV